MALHLRKVTIPRTSADGYTPGRFDQCQFAQIVAQAVAHVRAFSLLNALSSLAVPASARLVSATQPRLVAGNWVMTLTFDTALLAGVTLEDATP